MSLHWSRHQLSQLFWWWFLQELSEVLVYGWMLHEDGDGYVGVYRVVWHSDVVLGTYEVYLVVDNDDAKESLME